MIFWSLFLIEVARAGDSLPLETISWHDVRPN